MLHDDGVHLKRMPYCVSALFLIKSFKKPPKLLMSGRGGQGTSMPNTTPRSAPLGVLLAGGCGRGWVLTSPMEMKDLSLSL